MRAEHNDFHLLGCTLSNLAAKKEGAKKVKLYQKDILSHLPKYISIKKNDHILGDSCVICKDEFKLREFKRVLQCNHIFHKKCIDKWFCNNINNMICPLCKDNNCK